MNGLGVVSLLGTLVVPVAIVIIVVRALGRRREERLGEGHGTRRFFQYLLLLGLLVVALIGIVTLLGLAFGPDPMVEQGEALARGLTFTVLGGGLCAAVLLWTRSTIRSDPGELASAAWTIYLTFADLILAVVAAVNLAGALGSALDGEIDGEAIAGAVVWGLAWAVHWRLAGRTLDESRRLPLQLIGSGIGWVLGLIGLIAVLSRAIQLLTPTATVVDSGLRIGEAAGMLAAGAVLWVPHWLLGLSRTRTGPLWHGYVLVVGVGASLVTMLTGASLAVYGLLVWLVGDTTVDSVAEFVADTATPLSVTVVAGLSWWYHRAVLAARAEVERTEVTRVHDYVLAGIALGAAATGVALVVVALVDAVAPPSLVAGSVVNSVIAAVTLLVVGGPLWWWFWRRVQRARSADLVAEVSSPTRRVYLVLLFGVAGVVAVIVVLVAAFLVLDDALQGELGRATLRDVRVPLGILLAAGAVSGYHFMVQRDDRAAVPAPAPRQGPRLVLLVGPRDPELADRIHRSTGARVDGWDTPGPAWDGERVLAAVQGVPGGRVLVLSEEAGPRVVVDGATATPGATPGPAAPGPPAVSPPGPPAERSGARPHPVEHRDQPDPGGEQGQA